MRDLTNLDLMRSLAVLCVVASHTLLYIGHTSKVFLLGVLGVFLFFVHTTLVLMWSQERDPHPLRFYLRRAFRIYPLWLVVLFASVITHLPTSPAFAPGFGFWHPGWKELLENATLTFNLDMGGRVIGASWSLPIEVQMYVVLPFLFFFARQYRYIWPIVLLDVLAIATSYHMEGPLASSLLFCTPFFLPGAMAYVAFKRVQPRLPAWSFVLWLLALLAAFNAWASLRKDSVRSGWFFALLVGLTLPYFRQIRWKPLVRATHLIARYSYGVYLGHFTAIAVGVHFLHGHSLPVRGLAYLVTMVTLPVLLYHAVEKPMITFGSRVAGRLESGPEPVMNESNLSLEPAP